MPREMRYFEPHVEATLAPNAQHLLTLPRVYKPWKKMATEPANAGNSTEPLHEAPQSLHLEARHSNNIMINETCGYVPQNSVDCNLCFPIKRP